MNSDQIAGVARWLATMIAGYLVAHGLVPADVQTALQSGLVELIAAVVGLAMLGWSIYTHSTHNLIASVAAKPEVNKVITNTQATANAIPASNVVAKP